jgi:UDP-N-acetylmuramyl pentapeptide phosphotransferase/UDP-N-acetylglucosamine-1-phosphate transferase
MRYAVKKKMTVVPNERSLHDIPTPKGGGIAITLTWYIGLTVLFFSGIIEQKLYFALLSGMMLAVVSLIDDIKGLKPIIRLIVQFMTAILAFYFLEGLRPLIIPGFNINYNYFVYPFAIIGMVWFINLFNFMDGVDGFASVEVITVSAVLFVMSWNLVTILLIVCLTGFLCWNWPKAKIFMGDVGSTQLGFVLVVLGIYFHNTFEFSILNWIMLTSPFWFDATLTLFRRWRNKEKLSEAHRKHVYQRIVQAGYSHEKVNIFLISLNLIIITLIIIYREFKVLQIPIFALTMLLYYLITKTVDRRVPFRKGKE